jgi:NADPH-dependent 2,4-dienoyl-CoA reductase/sulfur reductase-like enzyme
VSDVGPDLSGHVVIVGAGHAGGTAAALLRQYGWTRPVTLIGDEPLAPYQRPAIRNPFGPSFSYVLLPKPQNPNGNI